MKKLLKITSIVLAVAILLLAVAFGVWNKEVRSLITLEKIDDHPLYRMTYIGDYGFDEFLKTGAKSDGDIEKFVTKRLLKGLPIKLGVTGDACTAFVTRNEDGDVLFCRNFDFGFSPALQCATDPDNGYSSISTVNLSYAGYSEDELPDSVSSSFLTLASPFLPFDGMNEKGVAMALLAVPEYDYQTDPDKVTLNTTAAIRLVLDKTANVDEAVELLKQYNIYFSGDVDCHFLIADSSGKSVIVEYYDGKLQTVTTDEEYQIASNFIAYNGLNIGEGYTEFDRYDTVKAAIESNGGILTEDQAIELLAKVGVVDEGVDKLQWSVIYNLTTGEGKIFAHRKTENTIDFSLKMAQ
ncbi:MAG: choloylglycine hydrolase [Firmicutes bacterium HGW-Firmicutes-16]|nr:MAG: choloylglycine hydrolase [Firmicutes bacterium HGW-Firmicutes-16]